MIPFVPLPGDQLSDVERWAVFLAAIAAGLVAVGAIISRIRRAWTRARTWVREGLRRADALDRLVQHELHPNSGGSLHDTVHRVDHRSAQTAELSAANARRLDRVEASLSTLAESQLAIWPAIEAVARAHPPTTDEDTP